jgi:hypothetical protein
MACQRFARDDASVCHACRCVAAWAKPVDLRECGGTDSEAQGFEVAARAWHARGQGFKSLSSTRHNVSAVLPLRAVCQQITLRDRNITSGVDRFGRLRWYSDAHLREGFPRTSSDRPLRAGDDAMAAGERASLSRRRGSGGPTPVTGFWLLTLYNEHHFFHPTSWAVTRWGPRTSTCAPVRTGPSSSMSSSTHPATTATTTGCQPQRPLLAVPDAPIGPRTPSPTGPGHPARHPCQPLRACASRA